MPSLFGGARKNSDGFPSLFFQQIVDLGLSVHRDTAGLQQLRRHAVSGGQGSGEGAVVDLSAAAGGTLLLSMNILLFVKTTIIVVARTKCKA